MSEQIRRRRLEKLSGSAAPAGKDNSEAGGDKPPSASSTPRPTESSENTQNAPPRVQINIRPAATSTEPSAETPSTEVQSDGTSADSLAKRPRPESDAQSSPRPAPKKSSALTEEPIEIFEDRTLKSIFRITLDPNETVDSANHKLFFLSNLKQDLEEANEAVRLSVSNLDTAIVEAASGISHKRSILDYLLPCWKRVIRAIKSLRSHSAAKDAVLKEAKRLCMSNCIFAVTVPELFGWVAFVSLLRL